MEKMDEELIIKMVNSDVDGNRCRGRLKLGWTDGVRRALWGRGMSVEQGRQNVLKRRRWKSIVGS